jgi:hypothetical protein
VDSSWHSSPAARRPLYLQLVGSGQMKPGYACDNDAGISGVMPSPFSF